MFHGVISTFLVVYFGLFSTHDPVLSRATFVPLFHFYFSQIRPIFTFLSCPLSF